MEPSPHNSSSTPETTQPTPHQTNDTKNTAQDVKQPSFVGEIIRFSLIALVIVLPVRMFIAQPFIVSGSSMEHTFSTGQYLIVDQLTYHFETPKRGDVIVFRYPKDPSKFFIKRIIGIPGDTIDINGNVVTITNTKDPKGVVLNEPYILHMSPGPHINETLGKDEYFVMGDNRDASSDSRAWGILKFNNIVGRAFLRLFPFSNIGFLPGEYDTDKEFIHNSGQ